MLSNIDVTHQMLQECFAQDPWNTPAGLMRTNAKKFDIEIIKVEAKSKQIKGGWYNEPGQIFCMKPHYKKEIDYFAITKGVIEE